MATRKGSGRKRPNESSCGSTVGSPSISRRQLQVTCSEHRLERVTENRRYWLKVDYCMFPPNERERLSKTIARRQGVNIGVGRDPHSDNLSLR